MDRRELIRRMVLNEICDDYENVGQIIFPNVSKYAVKLGLSLNRSDVVAALTSLVDDGLAAGYLLGGQAPLRIDGMPSLDTIETDFKTYFFVTNTGLKYHESDDSWWPFDGSS